MWQVDHSYNYWRRADTSFAGIHREMSELLDKEVNALSKYFWLEFTQTPTSPQKVCDEMKQMRKNMCVKILLMEQGVYRVFLALQLIIVSPDFRGYLFKSALYCLPIKFSCLSLYT